MAHYIEEQCSEGVDNYENPKRDTVENDIQK